MFTIVHGLLISDIWFSRIVMMVAGALCGACVAWSFARLVGTPSVSAWLRYNVAYLGMFVLLGLTSVAVFDPVTTVAALIRANEPPRALFARAMPMTLIFLLSMTTVLSLLYGRRWRHVGPILLTCAVLLALLGLNVSVLGLVSLPRGSVHLVAELFGLIAVLDGVYAGAFVGLERKTLVAGPGRSRRFSNQ